MPFQSTHPRGVRPPSCGCAWATTGSFNPRTREGATGEDIPCPSTRRSSIHAPARGATRLRSRKVSVRRGFNPRTREGCDDAQGNLDAYKDVSIHAPARGATKADSISLDVSKFQSTHPRGVRRCQVRPHSQAVPCFNPRTREGCDEPHFTPAMSRSTFQSTHPRGVRRLRSWTGSAVSAFQSTHPRGVRPATGASSFAAKWFQSTHPRGVRPIVWKDSAETYQFQSTHPRGVRPPRPQARSFS